MPNCPCCGDITPASAAFDELCGQCQKELELASDPRLLAAADRLAGCPYCGEALPEGAAANQLCPVCQSAMETGVDPEPPVQPTPPYVITKILVLMNFAIFLTMTIVRAIWPGHGGFEWGADWAPLSLTGQWWRLLTSTFVHASPGHLLGNLLFLWILGKRLEPILGKWTFLIFYLSCGLAGSLASLIFHPNAFICGASGGIFGLAGGLVGAYGLKIPVLSKRALWKLAFLVLWIAYSIYPDADAVEVDNAAHAAGLLTGLFLGALLTSGFVGNQRRLRQAFALVATMLLVGAISARFYDRDVIPLGPAARYIQAGHMDDALRELNFVLQQQPKNTWANVLAARIYLEKKDYSNAETAARCALAANANDDRAAYVLAMAELNTGRCNDAYKIIRKSKLERWPVSYVVCNEAEHAPAQEEHSPPR